MAELPDPQKIFKTRHAVGTTLFTVFIPSKDRDGQPINQEYWIDEVLKTLARHFRGATAYPRGRGVWRDDERQGVLLLEEPVIVFSYAADEAITVTALEEIVQMLCRMGRETTKVRLALSSAASIME